MSWNIRDHRRDATQAVPPGPPPTWTDTVPLPTVAAAFAWQEDPAPLWREEDYAAEGFLSDREVAWWRNIMTRGIIAL